MADVRITVVKKVTNQDLIDKYGKGVGPTCEILEIGDEFIVTNRKMPDGFCNWAWADIHRDVVVLSIGGDYPWTKEKGVAMPCCTDGFRPVTFKLERIKE